MNSGVSLFFDTVFARTFDPDRRLPADRRLRRRALRLSAMKQLSRPVPFVLAVVLALAACGGGGDDASEGTTTSSTSTTESSTTSTTEVSGPSEDDYVAALSASLQSAQSGLALPADDADCIATAMVQELGADVLAEAGISAQDLADADSAEDLGIDLSSTLADDLTADFGDCGALTALSAALLAQIDAQAGSSSSPADVDCMAAALDSRDGLAVLATSFVDASGDLETAFDESLADCPDLLAELFGAGIAATAGHPMSDAAIACIRDQIVADPDGAVAAFDGSDAANAFGEQLGLACAAEISG
jgi:hypothetical protein